MGKDTRHRKYQLTINNPGETWTHEKSKTALKALNLKYYCMADKAGQQEQTPHNFIGILLAPQRKEEAMQPLDYATSSR